MGFGIIDHQKSRNNENEKYYIRESKKHLLLGALTQYELYPSKTRMHLPKWVKYLVLDPLTFGLVYSKIEGTIPPVRAETLYV